MINNNQQLHPIPAVRAIIENVQGRVIVLKRANTAFGNGHWCLPGGKIDYGQTAEQALAIELLEELSVQLDSIKFFFYQDSLPLEPGGLHYINFYFHCTVEGEPRINEESSEYAWIGPQELESLQIVFKNDEALRRHFSHRLFER